MCQYLQCALEKHSHLSAVLRAVQQVDCSSSNDELVLISMTNSSTNKSCNDGDIWAMISSKDGVIIF